MNKLKIVRTIQKKKLTEIPFDRAKSCKYYTTIHPMYKDICKTCIKALTLIIFTYKITTDKRHNGTPTIDIW